MIEITTNPSSIDIAFVHDYLSKQSYWAKHIPLDIVERSIQHSLCFSVIKNHQQIGFARVITDQATFAYLCDVFIIDSERGQGYSKQLMQFIMNYPSLQGLRRLMLGTLDAHGLYRQFGYTSLTDPDRIMEIKKSDIYKKEA